MQSLGCRAEGMHVPCRAWSPPREETQPLPKYAKNWNEASPNPIQHALSKKCLDLSSKWNVIRDIIACLLNWTSLWQRGIWEDSKVQTLCAHSSDGDVPSTSMSMQSRWMVRVSGTPHVPKVAHVQEGQLRAYALITVRFLWAKQESAASLWAVGSTLTSSKWHLFSRSMKELSTFCPVLKLLYQMQNWRC